MSHTLNGREVMSDLRSSERLHHSRRRGGHLGIVGRGIEHGEGSWEGGIIGRVRTTQKVDVFPIGQRTILALRTARGSGHAQLIAILGRVVVETDNVAHVAAGVALEHSCGVSTAGKRVGRVVVAETVPEIVEGGAGLLVHFDWAVACKVEARRRISDHIAERRNETNVNIIVD